jgi:hypothetical protein
MSGEQFFEGVRAKLIQKDGNPKWHHKTVHDVKQSEVNHYFERDVSLNLDISKY